MFWLQHFKMLDYIRCPGCHLQTPVEPWLREAQREYAWRTAQERSGAAFVNWPQPERDGSARPCPRCGTPLVQGALIKGEYNERQPGWPFAAALAIGLAIGALLWRLFAWGPIAGAVGAITATTSMIGPLRRFHHRSVENRKLQSLNHPPEPNTELRQAARVLLGALLVTATATVIYAYLGWWPFVIAIAAVLTAAVVSEWLVERARRGLQGVAASRTRAGSAEFEFRGLQNRIVDAFLDAHPLASSTAFDRARWPRLLEAAKHDPAAQFRAARDWARGTYVAPDRVKAEELYERLAQHAAIGGKALWELGELFDPDSKEPDLAKARSAYERMKAFYQSQGVAQGVAVAERHLSDIRTDAQRHPMADAETWNDRFTRIRTRVYTSTAIAAVIAIGVVASAFPPIKESDTVGNASDALASGDVEAAVAAAQGAVRRDGTPDAYLTYGAALAAAGRPADAADAYNEVIEQNPTDETARLARATARRAAGNLAGAAEDYRALLQQQPDSPIYQALLDDVEREVKKR